MGIAMVGVRECLRPSSLWVGLMGTILLSSILPRVCIPMGWCCTVKAKEKTVSSGPCFKGT